MNVQQSAKEQNKNCNNITVIFTLMSYEAMFSTVNNCRRYKIAAVTVHLYENHDLRADIFPDLLVMLVSADCN